MCKEKEKEETSQKYFTAIYSQGIENNMDS